MFLLLCSALQGLLRKLGANFEDMLPMGVSGARMKVRQGSLHAAVAWQGLFVYICSVRVAKTHFAGPTVCGNAMPSVLSWPLGACMPAQWTTLATAAIGACMAVTWQSHNGLLYQTDAALHFNSMRIGAAVSCSLLAAALLPHCCRQC